MRLDKSAWHLLSAVHKEYPTIVQFYGGLLAIAISAFGRSFHMPPAIGVTLGVGLILYSIIVAYNKLENENEVLKKKLAPSLKIKMLSAFAYDTCAGQLPGNTSAWHGIIRDVRVSITNSSENMRISVVDVKLDKPDCPGGAWPSGNLPKYIRDQYKWTFEKTDALPDSVYLGPGETTKGSYLFSEVGRMQPKEALEKVNRDREFTLIITDSLGHEYPSPVSIR